MAFIPVPNTVEVEIRSEYLGQRVENTLYFSGASPIPADAYGDLLELIRAWWTAYPRDLLSDQLILRELYLTDLSSATGGTYTLAISGDPGGPVAADPLPGSIAMCVSFRTANRGRSFRGRNYVCGFGENQVSGNTFLPSLVAAMGTAYNQLLTTMGTTSFFWAVVSRYSNGAPRTTGIATPVTAAIVVDGYVDSQRRRLAGRGV